MSADVMSAQPEVPGGTVTFLFTDIEGSTKLLERLRDQYAILLDEQRRILRGAFTRWNGHEIDTQGDSFFVAFGRAIDAVCCVSELQRELTNHDWPTGETVRVRMGLHTGEPIVVHTGYVGMDVHRAARIAAAGYGGQVLLSQTTRDLVWQDLPKGASLLDLGEYRLKDIRFPQRIYQLSIEGLLTEFPTLRTLSAEEEPPAPGEPPYKGLQYFTESDAGWFFGRERATQTLVQAVQEQRFMTVIGASGSGKSSVVRAGLVPALRRQGPHRWQVTLFTPGAHPLESLAVSLTSQARTVVETAALVDDLQREARCLHLFTLRVFPQPKAAAAGKKGQLLVVVDQFEELFTMCRAASERQAFIDNLLYAATAEGGATHVLVVLRADFYQYLSEYPGLREQVAKHQEYLGTMSAEDLKQAIEAPAQHGGWEFSAGLVDLILHDVGASPGGQPEPGALPLLSHALLETWKHRRGNLMSLRAYWESGGVRGAIARTAETVFRQELNPEQQETARDIFLRLTELGEGTQDTRRRVAITELLPPQQGGGVPQVQVVLNKLADARLITLGEGTVEVAHEALIREWPTLRDWLTTDREGLQLHRHITEAAQEWELLERDQGSLLRGARLAQAQEWAEAHLRQLNALEKAFLDASREAAQREQAEREAQQQRELEAARKLAEAEKQRAEDQTTTAKRLRKGAWALGGAFILALILAAAALIFGRQASTNYQLANQRQATAESERLRAESEALQRATAETVAQDQARLATSRYLTSEAMNNLKLNSQLSAHLALEALKTYPTYDAENALHLALPELRLLNSTQITNHISPWSMAMPRDGQLRIVGTPEGIELTDVPTGAHSMLAAGEACDAILPTQDGRWFVANCTRDEQNYEQYVFETGTEKLLFTFPDIGLNQFSSGVIPPSATHPPLAFGGYYDLTIHIWDVLTGEARLVDRGHSGTSSSFVDAIASPDGKQLATFDSEGLVVILDLETSQQVTQFNARSPGVNYAGFSPDGTHLATVGGDNTIKIWDLTSLSPEPSLEHELRPGVGLNNVLYSPDGTRLAAGSADGLVRVWDAQSGELQNTLSGHAGFSLVLSFSQDGTRLYTDSNDYTIKEWDLSPGHELLTLPGRIGSAPFSPDGTKLALTAADGSLSVVDSHTGDVLLSWQAHSDWIEDIAWGPDDKLIATSSGNDLLWGSRNDHTAKIWEAATGQLLKELPGDEYLGFSQVAWSPDSSRLVTASMERGISLIWDRSSGELIRTTPEQDLILALAYSPDGQKIAVTSYTDLIIWDAITGNEVFRQTLGHNALGLAFSPDGQRLATGLSDGEILFFKNTGVGMVEEPGFSNGDKFVLTLAFSPDGALLASGDNTGKVRVWDLKTGQMRLEMTTFTDPVTRVAFSPDNQRLVASSLAGLTYFYVLPVDELTELARSRIITPMTPEQCREYLHTETCPAWP